MNDLCALLSLVRALSRFVLELKLADCADCFLTAESPTRASLRHAMLSAFRIEAHIAKISQSQVIAHVTRKVPPQARP